MKFLKKFLFWIFAPLSGIVLLMYVFDVDYLLKAVRVTYLNGYNTAFLDDYQYFDNRIIENGAVQPWNIQDRKSTRLNSSHVRISYAVFCLKKKKVTKRVSLIA